MNQPRGNFVSSYTKMFIVFELSLYGQPIPLSMLTHNCTCWNARFSVQSVTKVHRTFGPTISLQLNFFTHRVGPFHAILPTRAVFLLMLARFLATPAKPHRAINFTSFCCRQLSLKPLRITILMLMHSCHCHYHGKNKKERT